MPRRPAGAMHVAKVVSRQKGREYTSWLLRQSYREGASVKHRTLANLSALPVPAIEAIRGILRGETLVPAQPDWQKLGSVSHGGVEAVLTMMRRLGMPNLVSSEPSRERDLVLGMVAARVLEPASKLATTRLWKQSTLAAELGVGEADENELYAAMDWLLERQPKIEQKLAKRHLEPGGLVLYDLSSSYMEGRHCELAKIGYSRDGKRGSLQIEYGMIAEPEGRPVAIEVFEGNVGDPTTVPAAVTKLKGRFGIEELVLVGDRGMLTQARIKELGKTPGVAWISALRGPAIRALVDSGSLQLGLFDQRNLAEITAPEYPGERLVVCMNPLLADERARKRADLLRATEAKLEPVQERVRAGKLPSPEKIGEQVGKVIDRHKVAKHFEWKIEDGELKVERKHEQIAAEASLDGIYVIRTVVDAQRLSAPEVVAAYKSLAKVERAFRTMKSIDLQVRPVRHYADDRVRAHVFLCMLAYYVRWHLEKAWAPLLFKDESPPLPDDPVAPARRSPQALRKASAHQLPDGTPAHSFRTLLGELKCLTRDTMRSLDLDQPYEFQIDTTPNPLQARALELAGSAPVVAERADRP